MKTSKEIRQKYLDFFRLKEHRIIPSASLIPVNDSSTLFISSGMQPLIPYLLGAKHPEGVRLCNSQKSFRSEDIEEVGDSRHTTFFEMLGNWSLGDYFKKEQLFWVYEFLVEELGLDIKRLYATVFRGNQELSVSRDIDSVGYLKEIFSSYNVEAKDIDEPEKNGMQNGRIFYYAENKNWWSRSGPPVNMPIGEIGGPDSEIFYDLGVELKKHENSPWANQHCHVNCDCGRFIEIGNSVFIEFQKTEQGFEKLKQQNVDFGGGLERITMAVQNLDNIFETDLFINIINKIKELSKKEYKENVKSFEIIADHLRAAVFIIGDDKGIGPSNVGQGYIIRRLIRRAIRHSRLLGIKTELWTVEIAKIIADDYGEIYPELQKNINFIINQFKEEEIKFNKTIEIGLKEFEKICNKAGNIISGIEVFNLYQTYGFPIEMTQELAKEKGFEIDEKGFNEEFQKHQELSRETSTGMFKGGLADTSFETTKLHTVAHLMLSGLRRVLGNQVAQKGSNITAERLRFDFSHNQKMTEQEIKEVERLVNEAIKNNLPVKCEEMDLEKAKELNAVGVFDSKYENKVNVWTIGEGEKIISKEICGGPHIEKTGILGYFKIIKEESVSAGVRRIKAILE